MDAGLWFFTRAPQTPSVPHPRVRKPHSEPPLVVAGPPVELPQPPHRQHAGRAVGEDGLGVERPGGGGETEAPALVVVIVGLWFLLPQSGGQEGQALFDVRGPRGGEDEGDVVRVGGGAVGVCRENSRR